MGLKWVPSNTYFLFNSFPSFTNGVVTTIGFSPGGCVRHKDPIYYSNTYTLHCNFCTQNPEMGWGLTANRN